jgi:2-methylisocitrate lyase-like PEP mutase family enzyme
LPTVAEKRRTFRALHERGCFVIPNPWDVGSALYLQHLGFKALATTSSGVAWSMGLADGAVTLEPMLDHIRALVEATDLPVNADFLDGFAVAPEDVAANVTRCVATGVAGLSIEDSTAETPTLEFELAVDRVRAARAAIDAAGDDTLLVARSEVFLQKHPAALKESIRRLVAFADAGADCLYAPGASTRDDIGAIVEAVAPKPVNVLARNLGGLTVSDLAAIGVRRVSVGGSLARVAWGAFQRAASEMLDAGTFTAFADGASGDALNTLFAGRSNGQNGKGGA